MNSSEFFKYPFQESDHCILIMVTHCQKKFQTNIHANMYNNAAPLFLQLVLTSTPCNGAYFIDDMLSVLFVLGFKSTVI